MVRSVEHGGQGVTTGSIFTQGATPGGRTFTMNIEPSFSCVEWALNGTHGGRGREGVTGSKTGVATREDLPADQFAQRTHPEMTVVRLQAKEGKLGFFYSVYLKEE